MTWILYLALAYLALTLAAAVAAHRLPRRPVHDPPDWGTTEDIRIRARDGGFLEAFKVRPNGKSRGTVVLAHGWSRNRDRMTPRARVFGEMGFTCLMASARDHGNSSPQPFASALTFARDIEAVLETITEPVILYGHSAGAAGAVIAAARMPDKVGLLVLEGCFLKTRTALFHLYWDIHPLFGVLLGPMIVFWMEVFYRFGLNSMSPARLARRIKTPVLIIHGEKDKKFPANWALLLKNHFHPGPSLVYIVKGAGHSDSPDDPGYAKTLKSFVNEHWKTDDPKG